MPHEMDYEELHEMHIAATRYFRMQGLTQKKASQMSMVWMYNEIGFIPHGSDGRTQLQAAKRATHGIDIGDLHEGLIRYIEKHTEFTSGSREDQPTREPSQRYSDEPPRGPSRRYADEHVREKCSATEYDRMFQNGGDKDASRTSGKILTEEEIEAKTDHIYHDLLAQNKNPAYARQKSEQFNIREMGKRNAAHRDGNGNRGQSARPETGGRGYSRSFDDNDADDYYREESPQTYEEGPPRGSKASRGGSRGYSCDAGADPSYDTRRDFTEHELKKLAKQVYADCIEDGLHPEDARQEAKKWHQRHSNKQKPSYGSSAFDNFDGMQDALGEDKGYGRRSSKPKANDSARGPRPGARPPPGWGWDKPVWDSIFTAEPDNSYSSSRRRSTYDHDEDGSFRHQSRSERSGTMDSGRGSSGRGFGRGYRTEERRPGGRPAPPPPPPPPSECSGVEPMENLYKVLGVSKMATEAEIKSAQRKLSIKHHPDRVKGGAAAKKEATEKMAQINQACDVLMDKKMRAYYDRTGMVASMGGAPDA